MIFHKNTHCHFFQCINYNFQFPTKGKLYLGLHSCCHSFVVYSVFSPQHTEQPCTLTPPPSSSSSCLLCCGLVLGFSKPSYYECNACGCQSGNAGKGECGEDQPGGEIRSPSLLGRPVPERECQLLSFNFHIGPLLIPSLPAAWMKGIIFISSPRGGCGNKGSSLWSSKSIKALIEALDVMFQYVFFNQILH